MSEKKKKIIHHKIHKRNHRNLKKSKRKTKHFSKTRKNKTKSHHKLIKKFKPKNLDFNKKRAYTNIPNFDRLIGGGFEKDTANLLVGGSGSGKTIFAMQFLVEAMKKGERCLYVTFEEKKEQFYHNMAEFGWFLEEFEKKGLFTFLEYTPMKVKTMLEEGGGAIESIIIKKKIQRMVLDSIKSFELLFDNELEKREAALNL